MVKASTDNIPEGKYKIGTRYKNWFFKHLPVFPRRYQKTLTRAILIITGTVLAFLIIEIILRLQIEEVYDLSRCQSLDKNLHHLMIPNSTCRFKTNEWDVIFKINSSGLRSPEIKAEKDPGIFRILVLGDSFMQGYGIDEEKSFSRILEDKLNKSKIYGSVEVINGGVVGYSPIIEYLYLKKHGLNFKPDLVLLGFDLTDFYEDRKRISELRLNHPDLKKEEFQDKIKKGEIFFDFAQINKTSSPGNNQKTILPFFSYGLKSWLKTNVKLYALAVDLVKKRKANQPDVFHQGDIDLDIVALLRGNEITDEDWQELWVYPVSHLKLIKSVLSENGIPLVVIMIPSAVQVSPSEWPGRTALGLAKEFVDTRGNFEEELTKRLESTEILSLDLLADFKTSKKHPLYFKYDGHWNEAGHELAAEVTFKFLNKQLTPIIIQK